MLIDFEIKQNTEIGLKNFEIISVTSHTDSLIKPPSSSSSPPPPKKKHHTVMDMPNERRNGLAHARVNHGQSDKTLLPRGGGGAKFSLIQVEGES